MGKIRSRGNRKTELRLAALFRAHGITGWRRQLPLPGRPDFAFPKAKVAVFTDGCFWHGCPRCYRRPKGNRAFWDAKLARNRARDRAVARELRKRGWRVLRLWEHALAGPAAARAVGRVRRAVGGAENHGHSRTGTAWHGPPRLERNGLGSVRVRVRPGEWTQKVIRVNGSRRVTGFMCALMIRMNSRPQLRMTSSLWP